MKMCNACGITKPYSEFYRNSEVHDGYSYRCKICRKNRKPTNPEFTKQTRKRQNRSIRVAYGSRIENGGSGWSEIKRLDKYGLTEKSFNDLLESQNNCCAICDRELVGKFCIDHCHSTGAVRGLLCYSCNSGIGLLGDTSSAVQKALDYLKKAES